MTKALHHCKKKDLTTMNSITQSNENGTGQNEYADDALRWLQVVYHDCPPDAKIAVTKFSDKPSGDARKIDTQFFTTGQLEEIAETYATGLEEEAGIYARLSPIRLDADIGINGRGTKAASLGSCCLWVEIDPPRTEQDLESFKARALHQLRSYPLPPTVTDDSGRGVHAIWAVEFTEDTARIERSNLWLLRQFTHSDEVTYNEDRLFRLPGTFNPKPAARRFSRLIDEDFHPERIYSIDQFGEADTGVGSNGEFRIPRIVSAVDDAEIIRRIRASHSAAKFDAYMSGDGSLRKDGGDDQSSADMELLYIIGDHTMDIEQVDRIFSTSGFADKGRWRTEDRYRTHTLGNVVRKKEADWLYTYRSQNAASLQSKRFVFRTTEEALREPRTTYIIDGYLPEKSLTMIYGPSGSGKSFLCLDMAFHVALGRDWQGHKVKQGMVVYLAAEGSSGLRKRIEAWLQHHNLTAPEVEKIRLLHETANLTNPQEAELFLEALGTLEEPPILLFLDTVSWLMVGGDENSSRDAGRIMETTRLIRERYGTTSVLIHHTGHDGRLPRGSSSWLGNIDARMKVVPMKPNGRFQFTMEKQKDDVELAAKAFERVIVELPRLSTTGLDEPDTSCVIKSIDLPEATITNAFAQNSDKELAILKALESFGEEGATNKQIMETAEGCQKGGPLYTGTRDNLIAAGQIIPDPNAKTRRGMRYWHKEFFPSQFAREINEDEFIDDSMNSSMK
jgi:hypothetical protein